MLSLCLTIPILIYADVYDEYGVTPRCQVHFPGFQLTNSDDLYGQYGYVSHSGIGSADGNFDGSVNYTLKNPSHSNMTEMESSSPFNRRGNEYQGDYDKDFDTEENSGELQ